MLSQIKPLTQEQRQSAYEAVQQAVMRSIGERPEREQFDRHTASRYPPSVTRLINGLCIVLWLAAFTPSAIRLFVIGSETIWCCRSVRCGPDHCRRCDCAYR